MTGGGRFRAALADIMNPYLIIAKANQPPIKRFLFIIFGIHVWEIRDSHKLRKVKPTKN